MQKKRLAPSDQPLLGVLPDDAVGRILTVLPLSLVVPTCAALRQTCTALSNGSLAGNSPVWSVLVPLTGDSGSANAQASPSRRSARIADSTPLETFRKAWRALLYRAEALHHAVACAGQDTKDLTLSKLRFLLARFGSRLIDRASPVYNATLLIEICRARGRTEASLLLLCDHLISLGADACARPHSEACTPLIIAASRGMPRLVAFLLACGADPRPQGQGRFRLCGTSSSLAGSHCAVEWTRRLYDAELAANVAVEDRRALAVAHRVLLLHGPRPGPHAADPKAAVHGKVVEASAAVRRAGPLALKMSAEEERR
mmetsp:Transcript_9087/g.23784  ORF Transcript_9087/g.23784 Transcript_9087/m.23784 type:complete len:315 (+) Transcript_9087:24-968(+)